MPKEQIGPELHFGQAVLGDEVNIMEQFNYVRDWGLVNPGVGLVAINLPGLKVKGFGQVLFQIAG